jgi:hypothetical protein
MTNRYVLNLNQQSSGDYEVHKNGCTFFPITNYDELGQFSSCGSAVSAAKAKHPIKKINGCYYCANACHTS